MKLTHTIRRGIDNQSDARVIREEVFVAEQGFNDEFDAIDTFAHTLVVYADGEAAATGRVFPAARDINAHHTGTENLNAETIYIIGRVAVRAAFRGRRLGEYVMRTLEEYALSIGAEYIWLHAQTQARGFYERLGYFDAGDIEWEEHCPHISMLKKLR